MQLSQHLSVAEYIKSDTAKRKQISNEMTPAHLENAKILAAKIFEPIRVHFGKPIYLSSGYRSEALNAAVGGSLTSHHCMAFAMDLDQDGRGTGVTNRMVFDFIKANLNFDQLIWEFGTDQNPDWVHVSYVGAGNRKQVLKAVKSGNSTKYIPF